MSKLDSVLKSRNITLLTKVHIVKAMVFPVVMYGGESWTIMKTAGRNINNLRYADDTTLMVESQELKSLLMKVQKSENLGLKLNIQKTKIMASGPIISRQIDDETTETVRDFFRAPKSLQMVTGAMKLKDACSLEG